MKNKILVIANGIAGGDSGVSGGESRFIELAKNWSKGNNAIHLLGSLGSKTLCHKMGLAFRHHLSNFHSTNSRLGIVLQTFKSFTLPESLRSFTSGYVYSTNEQLYDVLPGLVLKIRSPKVRWAVVVHWLPPYLFWQRQQSSFFNSLFFLISERLSLYLACLFADRLLAVSDSTLNQIKKDPLARFFIKKAVSVSCGVDVNLVQAVSKRVKKQKYDAVFMKRIQAVKGIFDLIEIWRLVVRKKPTAKLIIIGSGHDEDQAKKLVATLGLGKNIKFLGPVYNYQEKFTYLAQSRLFLLPTYEENWAIVIGESMATGTPVLTYNLPELTQVWKNFATYIPLGNKTIFAHKILTLLSDSPKRRTLSRKAINFIADYDWQKIAEQELSLISNI